MLKDFNTGNAPAKNKNLLDTVTKMLVKNHNYKVIKTMEDAVGKFSCILRDNYGGRCYLIAKGSNVFQGTVSCQAYLPNLAAREDTPILLALKTQESPLEFYLFNPSQLLRSNKFNPYKDVQFRNFPLEWGIRFYPSMDVALAYKKIKYATL